MHCAASDGSCRVLQALIEAGCAVLAPTSDGMTPLEVAIDSQGSADEASTFDDVINMLRGMSMNYDRYFTHVVMCGHVCVWGGGGGVLVFVL